MFHIDQQSRVPIYEQLFRQVLSLAASGLLEENQQMPSVRQLAGELGINPNTVQKAYRELEREGLIYSVPGRGSFLTSTDTHTHHFVRELEDRMVAAIEFALQSGFSASDIRELFEKSLASAEARYPEPKAEKDDQQAGASNLTDQTGRNAETKQEAVAGDAITQSSHNGEAKKE